MRSKIRTKYGIEGGIVGDFFSVLCCGLCAITQQTRQLDMKGAKPAVSLTFNAKITHLILGNVHGKVVL